MNLEIHPRFRDLLPPLTTAEFDHLEKDILENGIREAIKVWQNKIVDGHNRYEIANNYDLPFMTIDLYFDDEDAACEWMIVNQLGRRNLEPNIKTLFIGQLYELQKKRVGNPNLFETPENSNSDTVSELPTSEKIAEEFNVSSRTVERAGKVAKAFEQADDEIKEAFKKGEVSQKRLVESAKREPEKPIDTSRFDSFTNNAKHHGNRIAGKIRELEELVTEANTYFAAEKVDFKVLARSLAFLGLENEAREARMLKRLEICPQCKTVGCPRCDEQGYLNDERARLLREELEREVAYV